MDSFFNDPDLFMPQGPEPFKKQYLLMALYRGPVRRGTTTSDACGERCPEELGGPDPVQLVPLVPTYSWPLSLSL